MHTCILLYRNYLCLPNPDSLRNWISNVDVDPGFLTNVLSAISKYQSHERQCNLIFVAMSIRKSIVWDQVNGVMVGFTDLGKYDQDSNQTAFVDYDNNACIEGSEVPATEVLVFMLVSLCGKFKWPIAYFLINHLSASALAGMVKDALVLTDTYGSRVWCVACDGTATNLSAMTNRFAIEVSDQKHYTKELYQYNR